MTLCLTSLGVVIYGGGKWQKLTIAVGRKGNAMDDNNKELIETMEGITICLNMLSGYLEQLVKILKDKSGVEHQ